MKPRVVICDVYGTLVDVLDAPVDAETRWRELHRRVFESDGMRTWVEHQEALRAEVRRARSLAQDRGVAVPEVVWEEIVGVVVPELRRLPASTRQSFLMEQAGLTHRVRLSSGAAACLARWRSEGVLLGIASNAQPYTEAELDRELVAAGLSSALFDPDLCFWSWRHGYAKPDPHVFRTLDVRVRHRGMGSHDVLMIGDRLDNDWGPARAWGWQGWHLSRTPERDPGGDWESLAAWWWGGAGVHPS